MARFIIDRDDPRTVEATSITAAVESYVRDQEDAETSKRCRYCECVDDSAATGGR